MSAFNLEVLLLPALAIFMLCLVITYKVTKSLVTAIVAALLKAILFLSYFGWLFDGQYTFLDDWGYLKGGERLLDEGVGLFNLIDNWSILTSIGGGDHVLYYLYSTYSFHLFGVGYFSPVACNILLTVLIAYFGAGLAVREFGLSYKQRKWFYIFLLFHPDILAWSNVMNGKDILILLLHILLLLSVSLFYQKSLFKALCIALPVSIILFFLRFYVPVLFVVALGLTTFISSGITMRSRLMYMVFVMLAISSVFSWVGLEKFQYAISQIQGQFVNPFYGVIRMILTPIPFNTEPAYAFLNIPALFHWLMMPCVILGLIKLKKKGGVFINFFFVYLIMFVALYSVYGELQGPRHRIQLDYAIAILQFIGLMSIINSIKFAVKNSIYNLRR